MSTKKEECSLARIAMDAATIEDVRTFLEHANCLVLVPFDVAIGLEPSLMDVTDEMQDAMIAMGSYLPRRSRVIYGRGWSGIARVHSIVTSDATTGGLTLEADAGGRLRLVIRL